MVLQMIDLCGATHTLPLPGGLFDQDALFIDLYQYVAELRHTREEMDQRQQQANARVAKAGRR